MRSIRLAAIDIGSNAARLLISEVTPAPDGKPDFTKIMLLRIPLRIGFDVFENGEVSESRTANLIRAVKAYKLLIDIYEVQHLKACATSAMRDAKNGGAVLEKVKTETGIDIKMISGREEAAFINENQVAETLDKTRSYLYVNVGGGSTELAFFSKGRLIFRESFNIGTIRVLHKQVSEEQWQEMKSFIRQEVKGYEPVITIGSGGNINKVFSLSKRKEGKPLTIDMLKDYYKEMGSVSLEERIHLYKMKEDRADVIVPALQIYIAVMRWAGAEEIYVPKIGLADGLIHALYREVMVQAN